MNQLTEETIEPLHITINITTDMTEPLSYCLDFQPGEDEFLDTLVNEHGDYLEKLTKREKLFMLSAIANSISFEEPGVVDNRVHQLWQQCYAKMSPSDLLAFMGALTEQIRWGHYAEFPPQQDSQPMFTQTF
jgi:hypothetical protein